MFGTGRAHWLVFSILYPELTPQTRLTDLPILIRARYSNNVSSFDLNQRMPGHVDIPRLKEGKVGGFFWCVGDWRYYMKQRIHTHRPGQFM